MCSCETLFNIFSKSFTESIAANSTPTTNSHYHSKGNPIIIVIEPNSDNNNNINSNKQQIVHDPSSTIRNHQTTKPNQFEKEENTQSPIPSSPPPPPIRPHHSIFKSSNSIVPYSMNTTSIVNAIEISRKIDLDILNDQKAMEKVIKLLLLGTSESGKSTVLKQMRIIHLDGFSNEELWSKRSLIFENVLQSMTQLIYGIKRFGIKLILEREIDANLILSTFQNQICDELPLDIVNALKRLWTNEKIQEIYERRSEFYLLDCAKYFLDSLDRICAVDYVPTTTDIIFSRTETVGVMEIRYKYKNMEFRIFDVGGQKTERRKWIHIFDNVNAIFFIAAISEYDQKTREDHRINRLRDAMNLFKDVGNNPLFVRVQIILFLNKKDIFEEKIVRIPLTACFSSYREKNTFSDAANYIRNRFESRIRDKQKMIYTHLTCATDTNQVQFLTNSITDMIIAENFKQTGIF